MKIDYNFSELLPNIIGDCVISGNRIYFNIYTPAPVKGDKIRIGDSVFVVNVVNIESDDDQGIEYAQVEVIHFR